MLVVAIFRYGERLILGDFVGATVFHMPPLVVFRVTLIAQGAAFFPTRTGSPIIMMLVPALATIGLITLSQRQKGRVCRNIANAASVLCRLTRVTRTTNLYRVKRRDARLFDLGRRCPFEPTERIK